jgi:hypothetical protein
MKTHTFRLSEGDSITVTWAQNGAACIEHTLHLDEEDAEGDTLQHAIDGVTTLILTCVTAGVDITTEAFEIAVQDAVNQLANRHL